MGFFGKIEENLHHGGVKIHLGAPSSVASNQVIPVQVTITSDSPQTIQSVKAEIKAEARQQGIGVGQINEPGLGVGESNNQTIAVVESREPFTINPGESKIVNLELALNGGAAIGNPMAQMGNMGGAAGGVLGAVSMLAQNFDHVNYTYSVHAYAKIDGIAMEPSDKQPIQLLPPSQNMQMPQSFDNGQQPPTQQSPMETPQQPSALPQYQPNEPQNPQSTQNGQQNNLQQ